MIESVNMKANLLKSCRVTTLALACTWSFFATASESPQEVEDASYALGASVGHYISGKIYNQVDLGAQVKVDTVIQGVIDALKGEGKMSNEEILTHLNARAEWLNNAKAAKLEALASKHQAEGQAYLAANQAKPGVKVTESGLQYEVIKQGDGPKPVESDVVTVHYVGKLLDGTEFDNSYERDEPNRFALLSVIDGWKEGIALMNVGSTYRLTIPAELAYGKEVVGVIPPGSTLIFDVELLKMEAPGENAHGMGLSGMGMGGMMGMGH
ncbi:FKBP-type peptidyl-prolyl cis-trans isomerase [Shewanella rhizosphaerae]|nr:FKBP-type peptidyl-prolyl cis-trans isomerase [Shewanella aegiceratis]QYJ90368.1 FKBP-type peptidyl-prolyl cis-trans isomerase [Shewanella halotolerans]QYK13276.1 FKBP-type peptidyl-prolyl cis-trans isomerase [Shewanella rhizosphaerae]